MPPVRSSLWRMQSPLRATGRPGEPSSGTPRRPDRRPAVPVPIPRPVDDEAIIMVTDDPNLLAVRPDLLLPDLIRARPEARMVLDRYGLRGCGGPLGPYESIRFFARAHGVDEARLLDELDRAIAAPRSQPLEAATAPDAPQPAD